MDSSYSDEHLRSLRQTRDELLVRVEIEEAAARAAQQRVKMFNASVWGILGMIVSSGLKKPWMLPKLCWLLIKTRLGGVERRKAMSEARGATAEGRYEDALASLDSILLKNETDLPALRYKREVLSKMGELTAMLEVVMKARALGELESLRRSERVLEGRLRELDPNWLPAIPGNPTSYEPIPGRVLHLLKNSLPQHTTGYTTRSQYTMMAQRKAGLDPVVVTSLGQPRVEGVEDFQKVEMVEGIEHHRLDLGDLPYSGLPPDQYLEMYAWTAAEEVRKLRPSVIHARSGFRGYEIPLVGLALSRHFNIPLVYEAWMFLEGTWTDSVDRMERGELYEKRVAQENRCMLEADHVVTIAESMKTEMVGRGIPDDHVTVVPNGVDAERFEPRPKNKELRTRLGLDEKVVLGYISNIGYREGLDILVRGIKVLLDRGENVAGLIVGDGPELPGVKQLAKDLGIEDRVAITGKVPHDEVAEHYALIDIFVIPRRDERAARLVTPLKPYEAMALGKPLLVAALPALLEVAEPPLRGAAFKAEDPEALADAAIPMIQDPQAREAIGKEARRWVLSERRWDRVGPMYQEVYKKARMSAQQRSAPIDVEAARPGDRESLRAEIQALGVRVAKAQDRFAGAEEKYWNHPMRKVRKGVREVLKAKGVLGSAKQVVRLARRWKAARGEEPDSSPQQRFAGRKTVALPGMSASNSEGSLLDEARRALTTLPRGGQTGQENPSVVLYAPLVRNNPFQALLYSRCWESGIAPIPVADLDVAQEALALPGLGVDTWFHVHWTSQVLKGSVSKADAQERLAAFEDQLDQMVKAGVRIAYTLHNVLPHEHEFAALEAAVVQALLDRASMVHCLTSDAVDLAAPVIKVDPAKVEVIAHPSYVGVYPEFMSQMQARYELGLEADDIVVAALGGIRSYKGIGPLLDAFEMAVVDEPRLRLIVAGKPIDMPDAKALRGRCEADKRIISHFGRIGEDRLQVFAKAADAIVLSHGAVLNSGVLPLALTFERPVIASNKGALPGLVTPEIGVLFDAEESDGLREALLKAEVLRSPQFRRAARARAEELAPGPIAEAFAAALRRRF